MRNYIVLLFLISVPRALLGQQIPDSSFDPPIDNPVYDKGKGPVIFIDEGHNNFHTMDGRYSPFSRVLARDGYQVKPYQGLFDSKKLQKGKILVIANALNEINNDNWVLPNPSAFTEEEIKTIGEWVTRGGSLFLIADHMPWPGAAEDLAAVFGFKFLNGFNISVVNPAYFWKSNATIAENIISAGRDSTEVINQIPNTEGQAFEIPADAEPILIYDESSLILLPDTAWVFNEKTPIRNIEGLSQGAYKNHGKGRVVIFGEASMFSAQIGDPGRRKMGMNNPDAKDNYKLLLNIIHWLDGILN